MVLDDNAVLSGIDTRSLRWFSKVGARTTLRAQLRVARIEQVSSTHRLKTKSCRVLGPFEDAYVDQELFYGVPESRDKTWDGVTPDDLIPSIEAKLPICKGPNGTSRYQIKESLIVTSDSVNRSKWQ